MMIMVAAATTASGGAVFAAQGALPGETLYPIKLASEKVSERLTISAERSFTMQAAHAERRLEETKELLAFKASEQAEQADLVRATMDRYEDNVFAMNEIASKMALNPSRPEGGRKTMLATEAILDRHADLVASATADEPIFAEAVLEHIDASLELETNVFEAMPRRDEEEDAEDGFDRRRRERTEKIENHLHDLKRALDDRRAVENEP